MQHVVQLLQARTILAFIALCVQKLLLCESPVLPGNADTEAAALPRCLKLSWLGLRSGTLPQTSIDRIAPHLARCVHVTSLDLSNNDFTHKAICVLAPRVAALPRLKELDVHGNRFEVKGGEALIRALGSGRTAGTLQVLNMCDCGDPASMRALRAMPFAKCIQLTVGAHLW